MKRRPNWTGVALSLTVAAVAEYWQLFPRGSGWDAAQHAGALVWAVVAGLELKESLDAWADTGNPL